MMPPEGMFMRVLGLLLLLVLLSRKEASAAPDNGVSYEMDVLRLA